MDIDFLYQAGLAWLNAIKMLRDRGFVATTSFQEPLEAAGFFYAKAVADESSFAEAFKSMFDVASTTNSRDSKARVGLYMFDRNYDVLRDRSRMISTDQVKAMAQLIEEDAFEVRIVLCPNKLSPQAKKEHLDAELFLFSEMTIELPKHELVPKHTVVSEAFVKERLGQSLDVRDLPRVPRTDAVARWFGWPAGTLLRIENPVMPTFRIVQ